MEMFTKDDQVLKSLGISLRYAAIFVPLNLIMALFLAMLITQPLRGVKVYRTIFYIPAVISGVAVSIIWSWILNSVLRSFKLSVVFDRNRRAGLAGRSGVGVVWRILASADLGVRNDDVDFLQRT